MNTVLATRKVSTATSETAHDRSVVLGCLIVNGDIANAAWVGLGLRMERVGVAWVVWERDAVDRDRYRSHVEWNETDHFEEGPEFDVLDDAIDWARRRATTVVVRPEWDETVMFDGTEGGPSSWLRFDDPSAPWVPRDPA